MFKKFQQLKNLTFGFKSVWKYISLARNAVAVLIGILLCYLLKNDGKLPFLVSGSITPGLPPFKLPPFHTEDPETGETISFGGMVSNVGTALVSIPLLSILESIAVAKAFCECGGITSVHIP